VEKTKQLFANLTKKTAQNFCVYINKHQDRIVNYQYLQSKKICSYAFGGAKLYGSGAVESAIKQIGRRIKISGAKCTTSASTSSSLLKWNDWCQSSNRSLNHDKYKYSVQKCYAPNPALQKYFD
jgi:hypothetical protein